MTGQPTLFPLDDYPAVEPPDASTYSRRVTLRSRTLLDAGIHPATRQPVDRTKTCGTCAHATRTHHSSRPYWKCDLHRLGTSRSVASDIRVSWPGCALWEEPGLS